MRFNVDLDDNHNLPVIIINENKNKIGGVANDVLMTTAGEGKLAGEGDWGKGGLGPLMVIRVLTSQLKSTDACPKRPQARKRRMGSKTTPPPTTTAAGYR